MLHLAGILLSLFGVFTQNTAIFYPPSKVCAVREFNVTFPCICSYPPGNTMVQMLWCSMMNNHDECMNPPYVYDSNSTTTSDFVYAGDNQSDCTLLIRNVQSSYSGEYRFRFITDHPGGVWIGFPGVALEVADLKVSLIRISGNGAIIQGDSLNLTCDMTCTDSSSEFVWSKNNKKLNQSGSVLHFPAVTVEDSGNYTCTWKSNQNSRSDSIFLSVQDSPVWIIVVVVVVVVVLVVGLILIGTVVTAVIHRKKHVQSEQQKNESPVYVNFRR